MIISIKEVIIKNTNVECPSNVSYTPTHTLTLHTYTLTHLHTPWRKWSNVPIRVYGGHISPTILSRVPMSTLSVCLLHTSTLPRNVWFLCWIWYNLHNSKGLVHVPCHYRRSEQFDRNSLFNSNSQVDWLVTFIASKMETIRKMQTFIVVSKRLNFVYVL